MTAKDLQAKLDASGDPQAAQFAQRFFKTGPGQYGEGDVFLGLRVPTIRTICQDFYDLPLDQLEELLDSPIHEHRLAAVIIMAEEAKHAQKRKDTARQQALYNLYLRRTDRINNWDIVDTSCRDVVGGYLQDKSRQPLYALAHSSNIWERRIAIVSTWQFIRHGQLDDTFAISKLLLHDKHDLIHKAVGWMLREAGKKDVGALTTFLDEYAAVLPRTVLRYAIERLPAEAKVIYMNASKPAVQL